MTAATPLPPPRFVSHGEMLIFGIGEECKEAGASSIPQQWARFAPHIGKIPGQIGQVAYGVIVNHADGKDFLYIAGVEVREFPLEPADFTRLTISPQTYAVFHHTGHVSTTADTWKAIYQGGLTNAGYKRQPGPELERYGPEFNAQTGLGGFEIWIPVQPPSPSRLVRTMIYVKNLDTMREFYQNTLNLGAIEATREANYIEFESGFALHAIPPGIAANIEIASPPQPREKVPVKLTFATTNLEAMQARLQSLGVPSITRPWGGIEWLDPEGNIFGLTS